MLNRLLRFFRSNPPMTYTIKRLRTGPDGTFGEFLSPQGDVLCKTCEDPWNDNKPRISCIPTGIYKVLRHGWETDTQVKFRRVWELLNVPNRSAILMHAGNTIDDTIGCILCGTEFGIIDGKQGIVGSRAAIVKLREILPEKFTLTVI